MSADFYQCLLKKPNLTPSKFVHVFYAPIGGVKYPFFIFFYMNMAQMLLKSSESKRHNHNFVTPKRFSI